MSEHSMKVGFSFGATSGIITTLGMIVGIHSTTHSRTAVIGAILTIAVADAFSDALGIHISEESEMKHTQGEIWIATVSTFISKLVFALTFAVPVLLFDLTTAVWVSIGWGVSMLTLISYRMAKEQKTAPLYIIGEHLFISFVVILLTHFLGDWIGQTFKIG